MYKGEYFNSISHLVGAVAGLVGLVFLVAIAVIDGDPWKIISFSIFGFTLFFLYSVSTLYHSARGKHKNRLMLLDYQAIYLLIAGTYTPFALVTLRGPWGWSIFGVIWSLAIFGIVWDFYFHKGRRILPLALYLIMGWLILIAFGPLLRELPSAGVWWLFIGGCCYTFGVIFYVFDRRPHFHGIWHLFVLAGSITHYFAVFFYVD